MPRMLLKGAEIDVLELLKPSPGAMVRCFDIYMCSFFLQIGSPFSKMVWWACKL